jgi:hypothetical protein
MDPEVRVNAMNLEVRGLFNRKALSLVHVEYHTLISSVRVLSLA